MSSNQFKTKWKEEDITVIRSVCETCHGGCGALLYVKDGKLLKVEGDKDNPYNQGRLCVKGLATPEIVNHESRLKHPMIRVGERGEGKWRKLGWEEALGIIAQRLRTIKENNGPESIAFGSGTFRTEGAPAYRLAYTFGTPNYFNMGTICYFPRELGEELTAKCYTVADLSQFFQDRFDNPNYILPKVIVVWGNNAIGNPDGFYGHWIIDAYARGTDLIVIDPRLTEYASKAKLWLQVRPGADGYLALSWINVIIKEKLYDKEFVIHWTNAPFLTYAEERNRTLREADIRKGGSREKFVVLDSNTGEPAVYDPKTRQYEREDVSPALTDAHNITLSSGNNVICKTVWQSLIERIEEYTPERAEEVTWIESSKIRNSARMYATQKPAAIHWGLGIDMTQNAVQTARTLSILKGLSGNFDMPGGNIIAKSIPLRFHQEERLQYLTPEQLDKMLGYPLVKQFPCHHPSIAHAPTIWDAILTGKPYPIKAMLIFATNPLLQWANSKKVYEALKTVDFLVTCDFFWSTTGLISDIVLPASIWAERDNFRAFWVPVITQNKAVQTGEAKSDIEIGLELGRLLNPQAWPWNSATEMISWRLEPSGLTFEQLKEMGFWYPEVKYKKYEAEGFETPTGRLEIHSVELEKLGYEPLPEYNEPFETPFSSPEMLKEYPLIMITGGRYWCYFHSQHRQVKSLRRIHPDPWVELNPETAKSLGIRDGDWVWIETKRGRCRQKAKLDIGIHPKVVHAQHGWWYPEKIKPGNEGWYKDLFESNINLCTDDTHFDPIIGSHTYRGLLCKIYKGG